MKKPSSPSKSGGKDAANRPWIRVLVAIVGALATIVTAWITAGTTTKHELASVRFESGDLCSNSNGPNFNLSWQPLDYRISVRTTIVGVQRQVQFAKPFQNAPQVLTALSVINLRSLEEVLRDLGYTAANPEEAKRLRELHVSVSATSVTSEGFILCVGVGLPNPSADFLIDKLQQLPVDKELLAIHRRFMKLDPRSDQLNGTERWMMNFYTLVGTVDSIWTATAVEP